MKEIIVLAIHTRHHVDKINIPYKNKIEFLFSPLHLKINATTRRLLSCCCCCFFYLTSFYQSLISSSILTSEVSISSSSVIPSISNSKSSSELFRLASGGVRSLEGNCSLVVSIRLSVAT